MRRDDEAAVFQVVEAILVAVLIASALVFFALVQKPTPSPTSPGFDLARTAGDALGVLQGDDPGGATDELQEDVIAVRTDAADAEGNLRSAVVATLPDGLRFLVRMTGSGTADCIFGPSTASYACTDTSAPEPRNAQGAVTYVLHGTTLVLVELVVWNAF